MAYSSEPIVSVLAKHLIEREGQTYLRIEGFDAPLPVAEEDVALATEEVEYRATIVRKIIVSAGVVWVIAAFYFTYVRQVPLTTVGLYGVAAYLVMLVGLGVYQGPPIQALKRQAIAEYCEANGIAVPTFRSQMHIILRENRSRLVVIAVLLAIGAIRRLFSI